MWYLVCKSSKGITNEICHQKLCVIVKCIKIHFEWMFQVLACKVGDMGEPIGKFLYNHINNS